MCSLILHSDRLSMLSDDKLTTNTMSLSTLTMSVDPCHPRVLLLHNTQQHTLYKLLAPNRIARETMLLTSHFVYKDNPIFHSTIPSLPIDNAQPKKDHNAETITDDIIDNAETTDTQQPHNKTDPINLDTIKHHQKQVNDLQDLNNQSRLELQNKTNRYNAKLQELQANCNHQNTLLQQKTNKLSEQDEIIQQLTKRLQDFTSDMQ